MPGAEENGVVRVQLARFASQCRLFAPLYRQATLTALRAAAAGSPIAVDRALGYNDVVDAWNSYLQRDNNGRGVVLIGHSQGSGVLTQLIRNEIDGKPVQSRLVSALLLGTNLPVPKGKDVGGAFQNIPLCRVREADRLRDRLRVVPLDRAAARELALRPRAGRQHGGGVREPRGARRAAAASCARIWPRAARASPARRRRRSRG